MGELLIYRSGVTGANTSKTYPKLAELMGVNPEGVISYLITKGRVPQEEAEITARILEGITDISDIVPGDIYFPHDRLKGLRSLFEKIPVTEDDGVTRIHPPFFSREIYDLMFH